MQQGQPASDSAISYWKMIPTQYRYIFLILQLIFSTGFSQGSYDNPDHTYSVPQLKSDLHFLKDKLERNHPGLYRYISKTSLNSFFDSLNHAIVRPMKQLDFLSLITLLHSKIDDGHTMFLPGDAIVGYNNTKGRFLPFAVFIANEKFYLTENYSGDSSIKMGEEVVSINGTSATDIISQLLKRQIRDGGNKTYPLWILNHYFGSYYSFVFGQPEYFTIAFKNNLGQFYNKRVNSLTKDSIKVLREHKSANREALSGIMLEENEKGSAAVITIKSFDADILSNIYQQQFSPVIDSIFLRLKVHHVQNLILDLRDNQGGDFEPGRFLLSYLLKEPSRYILEGDESRLIQIKPNHFTGNLYVLINGGTFSNSAIVCAELEKNKRAVFIGEETGGNKYIISGKAREHVLPNTKIRAFISTTTYRITNGPDNGNGIRPTYTIQPNIEDFLKKTDRVKSFALNLILKN
jgi:hypothetical protein